MFTSALLSIVALAVSVAAQDTPDPSIQTPPGVTQCEVSAIQFSGTHPPFIITAIPGGQVGQAPLATIVDGVTTSPYSWTVNLQAGTYITLQIKDAAGNPQYSAPFSVLASDNTTCLGGSVTTPAGSSTPPASTGSVVTSVPISSGGSSLGTSLTLTTVPGTSTPGSSTPAGSSVTTPVSSKPTSSSPSSSHPSSSGSGTSSAAPSSTSNAAAHMGAQWGLAGFLGLVGAAVLA